MDTKHGAAKSADGSSGIWRFEPFVFSLLIAAHVMVLWAFPYFPSQDGPLHLHMAGILRDYHDPRFPVFSEYFTLNLRPHPNWTVYLLLAGLMSLTPLLAAEKILLTGYLIGLPLAFRYVLKAISPAPRTFAVLIFPFLANLFFHLGFYNFCYSLVFYFLTVGFGIRQREKNLPGYTVGLMLLLLLTYFTHVLSWVMALCTLGVLALWQILYDGVFGKGSRMDSFPKERFGRTLVKYAVPWAAASLPSFVLFAGFLARKGVAAFDPPPPADLILNHFLSLTPLISFSAAEIVPAKIFSAFLLSGLLYGILQKGRSRRWVRWDGFLGAFAAAMVLFFAAPDELAGGSIVAWRLILYLFLILILWISVRPVSRMISKGIGLGAAGLAIAFLAIHGVKYAELNEELKEYHSVRRRIEPNTTLLPLTLSPWGSTSGGKPQSLGAAPFFHAAGYAAAERYAVAFDNFAAASDHFPVQFRPGLNPYRNLGEDMNLETFPPKVDFLGYERRTGRPLDYVLLWWVPERHAVMRELKPLFEQLESGYELILESSPRKRARLYRRKDWKAEKNEQDRKQ